LPSEITRVNRDVVDTGNAAVAAASCTDCQTVAVAIQGVLVFSDPDVVAPTNLALALNVDCNRCYTLASAYQFVSTTGVVHFTTEGNRLIAEIHRGLEQLRQSGLSIEEIQARVDVFAAELAHVLRTELVAAGGDTRAAEAGAGAPGAEAETTPVDAVGDSPDAAADSGGSGSASDATASVSEGDAAETSDQPAATGAVGEPATVAEPTATEPAATSEGEPTASEPATGDTGSIDTQTSEEEVPETGTTDT